MDDYQFPAAHGGAVAFSRSDEREWILVALNAADGPARLEIPLPEGVNGPLGPWLPLDGSGSRALTTAGVRIVPSATNSERRLGLEGPPRRGWALLSADSGGHADIR